MHKHKSPEIFAEYNNNTSEINLQRVIAVGEKSLTEIEYIHSMHILYRPNVHDSTIHHNAKNPCSDIKIEYVHKY